MVTSIQSYLTAATVLAGVLFSASADAASPAEQSAFPGYFHGGEVRIVSSSHQDTAWMNTPDACRHYRIEHVIVPALDIMRKNPRYTFCMEARCM